MLCREVPVLKVGRPWCSCSNQQYSGSIFDPGRLRQNRKYVVRFMVVPMDGHQLLLFMVLKVTAVSSSRIFLLSAFKLKHRDCHLAAVSTSFPKSKWFSPANMKSKCRSSAVCLSLVVKMHITMSHHCLKARMFIWGPSSHVNHFNMCLQMDGSLKRNVKLEYYLSLMSCVRFSYKSNSNLK